ncbi:MAG: hypothetical protein WCE52_22620 [Candidatus Acidiferrum sp.]
MLRYKSPSILLLFGLFLTTAEAQKKNTIAPANREQERRSFAMNVARAINGAEANYKKTHQTYATWDTLLGAGDFSESGTKWSSETFPTVAHAMYGRGPEIVAGWKLRLTISANGNAYDLLLEDANDPKCGYAIVSDERGQIRESKFLDCAS